MKSLLASDFVEWDSWRRCWLVGLVSLVDLVWFGRGLGAYGFVFGGEVGVVEDFFFVSLSASPLVGVVLSVVVILCVY